MKSLIPWIATASLAAALVVPACKASKESPKQNEAKPVRAEPPPPPPQKRKRRADMVGPTTVVEKWPMWKKFDSDGDGVLSDDEQAGMRATHAKELFGRFDSNADGLLSETEASQVDGQLARKLRDFKSVDSDGSGSIDTTELGAIIRY